MIAFLVAATLVKLALAAVLGGTADVAQQMQQARAFLLGADVLDARSTGHNPSFFLLGHYLIAAGALLAAEATSIAFSFWIKVPAVVADLGLAVLLCRHSRGGAGAAALYMVNPISLLLAVYHGQLHTVAAAGGVVALALHERGRALAAGAVLGFAVSVRQHFAVLLVPLLRPSTGALRVALAAAVVVVTVNIPLLWSAHLHHALTPTWGYGNWGYSIPLQQGPRLAALAGIEGADRVLAPVNETLRSWGGLVHFLWAAAFAFYVWRRPGADAWGASLLFFVGFYAVSPGFGIQWLIWALPWWLVVDRRGAVVYSTIAGAYLAGSYWAFTLNAHYGVDSITANLHRLTPIHLTLYCLVGALGFAAWSWCALTAWRLWRRLAARPAATSVAPA